jgi:acetyl-CoA carboxylase beta subunit
MSTEKPSQNEDEYFARLDQEELRKMRDKAAAAARAAERRSHLMKCPKCGADLHTEDFHGVQVDRCPDCHGIWLDHEEIRLLMKDDEEGGSLRKVMSDVWASLQKLRAGA